MKKLNVLFALIICLLCVSAVSAQTEEAVLLTTRTSDAAVSRMVWNAEGNVLTLVTKDSVEHIAVSDPSDAESLSLGEKTFFLTTVSEAGVAAALSDDMNTIYLYDPESPEKALRTIEPGFSMLSISVSKDASQVLADSAEEIRSVVFDTADGSLVYDLKGFQTAAPVYDSVLSPDGSAVLWHSRGTFALQKIADESFGETISLWDFASSYELSADNETLAVAIINDDYENGAVIFFDPLSGEEKGRTILGKTSPYEVSFSDDGSVLWAADASTVYQIDPQTFALVDEITINAEDSDSRVSRLAASPDGHSCAVLNNNGDLYLLTTDH